jgi:hypothetical protein
VTVPETPPETEASSACPNCGTGMVIIRIKPLLFGWKFDDLSGSRRHFVRAMTHGLGDARYERHDLNSLVGEEQGDGPGPSPQAGFGSSNAPDPEPFRRTALLHASRTDSAYSRPGWDSFHAEYALTSDD